MTSAHSRWALSACTFQAAQSTKTVPAASTAAIVTAGELSASNSPSPTHPPSTSTGTVAELAGVAVHSDCNVDSFEVCMKIPYLQRRPRQRRRFPRKLFQRARPQALFASKRRHLIEVRGYRCVWPKERRAAPQPDLRTDVPRL